jgi:hypothetical protein
MGVGLKVVQEVAEPDRNAAVVDGLEGRDEGVGNGRKITSDRSYETDDELRAGDR